METITQNDREALLLIQNFRKEYEAEHGRLYTSDEVVALVNDIRKELKEKGKL